MNDARWRRVVDKVEVSQAYKDSCIGWILHSLVLDHKPEIAIEIGTFCGFTAIFIAAALAKSSQGQLQCFDLWEQYQYKSAAMKVAYDNIELAGLQDTIILNSLDAQEVPNFLRTSFSWQPFDLDFVYLDISNTGETFRWAATEFYNLLSPGGLLVLEGGIKARDQVEWMVKYNKPPIMPVIEQIRKKSNYTIEIYENFPGLTVFKKL